MAKPKPRGKSRHGGARPNSGRKSNALKELRANVLKAADDFLAAELLPSLEKIRHLARGGYERVEEKYSVDENGEFRLTERKVTVADADRAAAQYLVDRVLGRPRQSIDVHDADDEPDSEAEMVAEIERALERHAQKS